MPKYRIEYFELVVDASPDFTNAYDALLVLIGKAKAGVSLTAEVGAFVRELWRLHNSGSAVRGAFRKFRMSDLPEIASIGGSSQELTLAEDQGLVEKNFFTLYRMQSLLLWHSNGHGSTPGQFAAALGRLLGSKVEAIPIIQRDAIKRLMRNEVEMRSIELSIPRPKSPDFYAEEELSSQLMATLAATKGDRIRVYVSTDARTNSSPHLSSKIKKAIRELVMDHDATVARTNVIEDGVEHPIDLIADRLLFYTEIEHDGRYPAEAEMFAAFDAARDHEREVLDAVLGTQGSPPIR